MSKLSSSELLLETQVEGAVLKAANDLDEPEGASFTDIVRYISIRGLVYKIPDANSFHLYLSSIVDKGLVAKLSNGNYKLKESARTQAIVF